MSIKFQCQCGRSLRAPDDGVGKRGRCPACRSVFTVPAAGPAAAVSIPPPLPAEPTPSFLAADNDGEYGFKEEPKVPARQPRPVVTGAVAGPLARPMKPVVVPPTTRPYRYLVLLVALLPLAWATFAKGDKQTFVQRLEQTVDRHPEAESAVDDVIKNHPTKARLLAALPNDRLDGALLAYESKAHWAFAALSGAAFFVLVVVLFPPGHTKVGHLVGVAAFTGTAGILLLLGFQFVAFHVGYVIPRGIVGVLFDLVWLVGQSYRLTMGEHDLVTSLLGFTAGVGFCEEACKALPLIAKARGGGFTSWRSALLWGLVSGVGFGVSEGVTYCGDYYNGVLGGQIYLVRFVSCVALHAIWTAAVGVALYRKQDTFRGQMHPLEWIWRTLAVVVVPMCLHGAYDTLLTHELDWAALAIAFASFGWLAWQIEQSKRVLDGYEAWAAGMRVNGRA